MTAGAGRSARGRKLVNGLLGRVGLRLVRIGSSVVDCRDIAGGGLEAAYLAGGAPFVFNFALSQCRIVPASGFACTDNVGNPFVDTLSEYGRGETTGYVGSPLQRYYARWQPMNAAEVLGLAGDDISPELTATPPLGFVMPWSSHGPDWAIAHWQAVVQADHREHGGPTDPAHGWKGWGPVSDEVGRLEFGRLTAVYQSIKIRGYQRDTSDDGDMGGVMLCADDGCRVLVTKGHHRAAALCALGHEFAPFRIQPGDVIRRAEVAFWPQVRSGLFSREHALEIFDRLYAGRQQPTASGRASFSRAGA